MSLGDRIRDCRKERQLTLTELSKRTGVSPSFLSSVERDLKKPSLGLLKKIGSHLNVSLSYLMRGESAAISFQGERLRGLREERYLSIEELAELSNIPASHIADIESNLVEPSLQQLERLADSLNVSSKHLIEHSLRDSAIGEKIRALREEAGMSQVRLADAAQVSAGLISQIEKNMTRPSLETLERIARCFQVEPSSLIADAGDQASKPPEYDAELAAQLKDPKIQSIIKVVSTFEQDELVFLLNFLDFFKKNRHVLF